jgi:hypothetical protein
MTKNAMVLFLTLALSACGSSGAATTAPEGGGEGAGGEHAAGHGHGDEAPPEPTRVLEDGSRLFGSEMSAERESTPLATIVASPDQFEGQVVKTEGEISQVCQAMGCWMELRTDAESPGIRVPMANHSFFLPRDVAGSRATIEGTVRLEPLSEERRAHLESEGATATGEALSIEATSVVVH